MTQPAGHAPQPRWQDAATLRRAQVDEPLRHWLLDQSSLTGRLQTACKGCFSVRVLNQSWQRPRPEESRVLGQRFGRWALVREVQLLCEAKPWVFARTVIPAPTLSGPHRALARLGARPLGGLLFATPGMRRGPLQVTRIGADSITTQGDYPVLWGRRSLFYLNHRPLLVSEFFLPAFLQAQQ